MKRWLHHAWYNRRSWLILLTPLSALFYCAIKVRRLMYRIGLFRSASFSVPIIVVGNITTGGAGKTPTVIALATALKKKGFQVGIVSRGYGNQAPHYPYIVTENSPADESGDEPLLLARKLSVPVVISPQRTKAVSALLDQYYVDVVLSDDGLQHYAMQRDFEIAMIDADKQLGNGWLLPAGPLRETVSRLQEVNCIVYNGGNSECNALRLEPLYWVNLVSNEKVSLTHFNQKTVNVCAGIGHPERFFTTVKQLGVKQGIFYPFEDHYAYTESDFNTMQDVPILMTEKDAVKCESFAADNMWYLAIEPELSKDVIHELTECISQKTGK